ncbi:hypothetical protein F5884DRAFT_858802 [Xylogone sp. PMI_703]|nr:hypothetical protein F5884DRAFT_858802 [Xylogone sp. PMI_703]
MDSKEYDDWMQWDGVAAFQVDVLDDLDDLDNLFQYPQNVNAESSTYASLQYSSSSRGLEEQSQQEIATPNVTDPSGESLFEPIRASTHESLSPSLFLQLIRRNKVEKQYYTNINEKLEALRQRIFSLCQRSSISSESGDELEDVDAFNDNIKIKLKKYGKAEILIQALTYIKYLKKDTKQLRAEATTASSRINMLEKPTRSYNITSKYSESDVAPHVVEMGKVKMMQVSMLSRSLYTQEQKSLQNTKTD